MTFDLTRSAAAALRSRDRGGDADRFDLQDGHRLGRADRRRRARRSGHRRYRRLELRRILRARHRGGRSRQHDLRSGAGGIERRLLLPARMVARKRALAQVCAAFGLDAKIGIDLPGENEGNWPTNAWEMRAFGVPMEPSDACFLGIGQGAMQATPLQMANVASTVINGGTLYRPQIVREIRDPDGRIGRACSIHEVIRHVPVTASALAAVRAGMARVTDPGGTAYGLAIDGLAVLREDRARSKPTAATARTRRGSSPGRRPSPEVGDGGLRRSQRRLRRDRRRADRAADPRPVLQQEKVVSRAKPSRHDRST